jgi:hypothetical protein
MILPYDANPCRMEFSERTASARGPSGFLAIQRKSGTCEPEASHGAILIFGLSAVKAGVEPGEPTAVKAARRGQTPSRVVAPSNA